MSPKKEHESIGCLLGRMIETFSECHGIEIVSVASTTFHRPDLDRGFEADEAYYIKHADAIREKEAIDLAVDSPPDLVIEIELTSSAIRKLDLLAAMEIPELWRHDGDELKLFLLDGPIYHQSSTSRVFPDFPLPLADSVLARRHRSGAALAIGQPDRPSGFDDVEQSANSRCVLGKGAIRCGTRRLLHAPESCRCMKP